MSTRDALEDAMRHVMMGNPDPAFAIIEHLRERGYVIASAASPSDSLDAAWAAAEAALPEGGWLSIVGPDASGKGDYVAVAYGWGRVPVPIELAKAHGLIVPALRALTENLSATGEGSGSAKTVLQFPNGSTGPGDWDPTHGRVVPARKSERGS